MKKRAALLALSICLGSLVAVAPSASAATPASCDFTTHVDVPRIVINAVTVKVPTHVTVAESGCDDAPMQWAVEGYLAHGDSAVHSQFMSYDGPYVNNKTDKHNETFYARDVAGAAGSWSWVTKGSFAFYCNANDDIGIGNDLPCTAKGDGPIKVKFGSRPKLSATRSGSKVSLHTRATRFFAVQSDKDYWGPERTAISIQRLVSGKWTTIHTATPARPKTGYTWTTIHAKAATYRATTPENRYAFAGRSATVKK